MLAVRADRHLSPDSRLEEAAGVVGRGELLADVVEGLELGKHLVRSSDRERRNLAELLHPEAKIGSATPRWQQSGFALQNRESGFVWWIGRKKIAPRQRAGAARRPRDAKDWVRQRQPRMQAEPQRLVFIDECGTKTNMTRSRGRARRGVRVVDDAPFRHAGSQTFIAGLRHDRLVAPWVLDGPINRAAFDAWVETQLAPTLARGDVVILDNLAVHRSPKAEAILRATGAWFLFLPPYSPDLNPIEMAFAKLKARLRRIGARTIDALWRAIGEICDLFTTEECWNYLRKAAAVSEQTQDAVSRTL
ncbi:MAG: IS630 family transposase [Amaricoccus sp.]